MNSRRRARLLPWILCFGAGLTLIAESGAAQQEKRAQDHEDHDERDRREHGHDDGLSIAIVQPVDGTTVPTTRIPVTVSWSVEPDDRHEKEDRHEKKHPRVGVIALRVDGREVAFFANVQHLRSGTFTFENVDLSAAARAGRPAVLVARAFEEKPRDHRFEDSAPVRVTVGAVQDTTPPVLSALQPPSGGVLSAPRPTISATITDAGGSGVDPAAVVLRLDGVVVAATVTVSGGGSSAAVSFTPPAPLPAGAHAVTLDAKDLAGNAAATATSTFTLDLSAPAFANPAPVPGSFLNNPRPSIGATLTDAGGAGVDPAGFQVIVDGGSVLASVSIANPNQATVTFVPGAALAAGLHTVTVSGRDAAGNPAALTWTFTLDPAPPVIGGLAPPNGSVLNVPRPALTAAITDPGGSGVDGASVVPRLDGVVVPGSVVVAPDFSTATLAFTPALPLSDGTHAFSVDARDRAGNAALPATAAFLIDTQAPLLAAPSPPDGVTVPSGTAVLSASWGDPGSGLALATARIAVDGVDVTALALIGPAGFSFTPAPPLSSGPHAVIARIQDRAGNLGTLSWSFIVAGPPPAPVNLAATPSNSRVVLAWTPVAGATGYKVFRAAASGAYAFASPLASGIATPSFTDATAVNGTTYFYVVEATNASGDSVPSNEASAMPNGNPSAPTNLVATAGNAQVSLTWAASSGALTYKVFRAQVSNGYVFSSPLASGLPTAGYLDSTAVNGTTYFYVVEATTAAGDSGPSNEASAAPNGAPAAPVLQSAVAGDGFVSLSWTAVPGAISYKLFRSTTSGIYPAAPLASGLPGTGFSDATVANGTSYFYVVKATNAGGDSPASNERSAMPTGPTGGAPAAPRISTPPKKTNDTTPIISGVSDPNTTVTVLFNGGADGTTTADGAGNWTYHNTTSFKGDGIYRVTATASNSQGTSGPSAGIQIEVDTTAPDVPANLQASARDAAVLLTWSASAAADTLGYNIYRKGPQESQFRRINSRVVTGTHYVDSPLNNGTLYEYRVSAVDDTLNEAHP